MARIYLGNVKGPQGATGATGATGPQGEAATIEVGSVSTTAYGNAAQVTNVGSSSAAKFNFVIPQGKPGEKTTKMGELTLDTITTSVEEFPSPAVGDTGATVFGKIVKFFSDVLASLTNKIDVSKIANDFTTTDPSYVAAAPTVKALNDSLTNLNSVITGTPTYSNAWSNNGLMLFKVGRLCVLHLAIRNGTNLSNAVTLPQGFRPTGNMSFFIYDLATKTIGYAYITTSTGDISLNGITLSSSANNIIGDAVYYV